MSFLQGDFKAPVSERTAGEGGLPLISVIVPVHNGQDYLENCINSILGQTWRSLEVLIVNDGSTDRTGDICQKLQRTHENIRVIPLAGCGVSAARNAGLEAAGGDYVTFVDADDRIHPRMLEVLYQGMNAAESDVAGCRFFTWQSQTEWEQETAGMSDETGGVSQTDDGIAACGRVRCGTADAGMRVFSQKEFVLEGILKNDTRCWSKLYKKQCLRRVRFREGLTIGEDMLFLVDMLPYIKKSVSMDFKGYGYFQNSMGAMNRAFKPSYMDQISCWKLAGETLTAWMDSLENPEKQNAQRKASERSGGEKEAVLKERLTVQERRFVEETAAARQMTGILLTVGKLAALSGKERREYKKYIERCHQELKLCLETEKGISALDRSYQYKVSFFAAAPQAYVRLYGMLRRLKP